MALNIGEYNARIDSYGNYSKQGKIDHEKAVIKECFKVHPNYQSVSIEGSQTDVHIITSSSLQTNPEINQMNSYPDEYFNNGDYVLWNGVNWIILNELGNDDIQERVEIRRCRISLKWKDENDDTFEYPACHKVLSESTHGEVYKEFLNTSDGKFRVYIQKNDDTKNIFVGQRFLIGDIAYSVGLIENVEFDNVYSVFLRFDETNKDTDNKVDDIADNTLPDLTF